MRRLRLLVTATVLLVAATLPALAIDFEVGTLQGTIIWNGAAITGPPGVSTTYVDLPGVATKNVNPNGTYVLDSVQPGSYQMGVYTGGCGAQTHNQVGEFPVTVVGGTTTDADVDITATAGRVTGSVTVNGTPLPAATFAVYPQCSTWYGSEAGEFVNYMPPGTYDVNVHGPTGVTGTFSFSIVAGESTDLGNIDFEAGDLGGSITWGGATITGPHLMTNFVVLPGVIVAQLNQDGTYTLTSVRPGDYLLGVYANGCPPRAGNQIGELPVTVVAGETTQADVDITATAGRVRGAITINGTPAVQPMFRLGDGCSYWYGSVDDGAFVNYMPPGTYEIDVVALNNTHLGPISFTIVAGETTDLGTIDFGAGDIEGTVFWNGAPLNAPGGTNYVDVPGVTFRQILNGDYSVTNIPPGSYDVGVYTGACGPQFGSQMGEFPIEVVAGEVTETDLDITATAGLVVGSVTVNGAPMANLRYRVGGSCNYWFGLEDGSFINFMPPGTYDVNVSGPNGIIGTFVFPIVAGQTTDVDFGSTPPGTDVEVELQGGLEEPGGVSIVFDTVTDGGNTVVVGSGVGPAPPTGYEVLGLAGSSRYWDLETTATYVPPITVCFSYDPAEVDGDESSLELWHFDADDTWENITVPPVDTVNHVICGIADSLSPFAVLDPLSVPTTTDVASSPNPSTYGQPVTFTATVDGSGGAGTVGFFADGSATPLSGCGSVGLASVGGAFQAVCTTTALGAGSHTIVADYSGDTGHGASSDSASQTVGRAALTVTAADKSKVFGQANPPFTASYSGFVNGEGPSALGGTLAFETPATATSPVGTYRIRPSGLTSANYAITYVDGTLTVAKAPTTLVAANSPRVFPKFRATLTRTFDGAPLSGRTVAFRVSGTTVCSAVTNAAGVATCGTIGVILGPASYTATFGGDASYVGSTATGGFGP